MASEQPYANLLNLVRRRARLIAVCAILTAIAALLFSHLQTPKYTATASLVFNNSQQAAAVAGLAAAGNNSQATQENTDVELVRLGDGAERTAGTLGKGLTKERVKEDIQVSAPTESNIVKITATTTSPALSAKVANTYAQEFVSEQQKLTRQYYLSALAAIKTLEHAGTPALRERAVSLGLLAALPFNSVEVAEHASLPTSASSPKTSRNVLLGLFLGLLLGLGLAFVRERSDRRILNPRELVSIYHVPLIGVVPGSDALADAPKRGPAWLALPPGDAEVFNLIRAHMQSFSQGRQVRSVLVASADSGEGKTTIAAQIAAAAARADSEVLLLEADLRHPTLARILRLGPEHGLLDVLMGTATLFQATQSLDVNPPFAADRQRKLDVLVAGRPLPANPGGLIDSQEMGATLELATSAYDLVVIDTPPLAAVSDTFSLLSRVDAVILVAAIEHSERELAERVQQTLAASGAPVLGVIANTSKAHRTTLSEPTTGGLAWVSNYWRGRAKVRS